MLKNDLKTCCYKYVIPELVSLVILFITHLSHQMNTFIKVRKIIVLWGHDQSINVLLIAIK